MSKMQSPPNSSEGLRRKERGARLMQQFREADKDGSGRIDAAELVELLGRAFPDSSPQVVRVWRDVLLRECDKNKDGEIQYQEFAQGVQDGGVLGSITQRVVDDGVKAEKLAMIFQQADMDGSGQVEVSEIARLLERAFPETKKDMIERYITAVLSDCDRDNSGTLSLDEFIHSRYLTLLTNAVDPAKGPDYDAIEQKRLELVERCPRQVRYRPSGVRGGMHVRCPALSPRRRSNAEEPDGSVKLPHLGLRHPDQRPRAVERLEVNDFQPMGTTGDKLLARGEEELEGNAAQHPWNEAKEYFSDAAQAYLIENTPAKAGDAFIRASDCMGRLGRASEAAALMVKAADAYEQAMDWERAIESLGESIEIYEEQNTSGRVIARMYKRGAELFERMADWLNGIDWFEQAAVLYEKTKDIPQLVHCLLKVAQFHAQNQAFAEAVSMYERVADITIQDGVTGNPALCRMDTKDHYFKAVLCGLAKANTATQGIDRLAHIERAKWSFEKYGNDDLEHFNSGFEFQTAQRLCDTALKQDVPGLRAAIQEYVDCRRPEQWLVDLLYSILASLEKWLEHVAARAQLM